MIFSFVTDRGCFKVISPLTRETSVIILLLGMVLAFNRAHAVPEVRESAQTLPEYSIGFESLPQKLSILTASHPSEYLLQSLSTEGLTRANTPSTQFDPPYRLSLANNMFSVPSEKFWGFQIRDERTFSDGKEVSLRDVYNSLKRCQSVGILSKELLIHLPNSEKLKGRSGQWLGIELLSIEQNWKDAYEEIPLSLSHCPVLEASSSEIFGPDVGTNAQFIASGIFVPVQFRSEFEYVLRALPGRLKRLHGIQTQRIHLKAFPKPERGLTALRSGSISAYFIEDEATLQKALRDDTLVSRTCWGHNVVSRRSSALQCDDA